MPAGDTGYRLCANLVRLMAERADLRPALDRILAWAIDELHADRGFLVIPTPQNRYAPFCARKFDGSQVPLEEQTVSRALLDCALDMGDVVVTEFPFEHLVGSRGTIRVRLTTLQTTKEIRSAIVAPLVEGARLRAAIVLYEKNRKTPFQLTDRRALDPLVRIAASTVGSRDAGSPSPRAKERYPGLVGSAPRFARLLDAIGKTAPTEQTVLITGESGTGKERIARALHALSRRAKGPFVVANMAVLTETIAAAELMGYVKGAFTGADTNKLGLVAEADGGTLFLDEVGETPLSVQAMLLRAINEKAVRPLGGKTEKKIDVRILAATNRNLEREIEARGFREDLYYRLAVVRLEAVPLRERKEDIPDLVQHFLSLIAVEEGGARRTITRAALERLAAHDWPGNVRELENVIREAWVLGGEPIDADDLRIREKIIVPRPDPEPDRLREQYLPCPTIRFRSESASRVDTHEGSAVAIGRLTSSQL